MSLLRQFIARLSGSDAANPEAAPVAAVPAVPEPANVTNDTPLDLDPLAPTFVSDPYPLLDRLRTEEPAHRNSSALWALTRHADIVAALGDPRFGNAPSPYAVVNARNRHRYVCADVANNIIPFLDPPDHDTPRRLIGRAFAKKMRHQPPDLKALAQEFLAPLHTRVRVRCAARLRHALRRGRHWSHPRRAAGRGIAAQGVEPLVLLPVHDDPLA